MEGRKPEFKSMIFRTQGRKKHQSEQQEEESIQKNEDSMRTLWDISKPTNIWIIGVPEGEEEKQEIQNLFERIMRENFPNLVKETDL